MASHGATIDDRVERFGPALVVGRRLGDFVVQTPVDVHAGVYRATQQSPAREAIIKILPAGQPPAPLLVQRFLRESELASRLDHPYAAHIYAFGAEPDGLLWIAMELVRGTPLDTFVAENGPMLPERFVPFLQRLAEVIDAAHEAGIVHRDIKPANVMTLSRAGALFPKLLDFGVAVVIDDAHAPSTSIIGSPHYIAPEQWRGGGPPMPLSDLYSLAVTCFEVLSGRVPFDGASLEAIARAHQSSPLPLLVPERASPLDAVLARALAKDPAERYPTAQAFAEALRTVTFRPSRRLPRLAEELRDHYLIRAPRPLAEAVADLAGADHPHQALEALWQLASVATRLIGVVALAARLAVRTARDEAPERELLVKLRRRPLTDDEWLLLAQRLAEHHGVYRDAYPVPELVDLLAAPAALQAILAMRATATRPSEESALELLTRAMPHAAALLESLRFFENVPLVISRGGVAEEWMGVVRGKDPILATARALADGCVALANREGAVLLELSPLVQVRQPHATGDAHLFLFDGGERELARLIAPRAGFMISDPVLWSRLEELLQLETEDSSGGTRRDERSPYLGLAAFSTQDAGTFVGREREVETFLNRLRVQPFVGIIGPSGAGKTSFLGGGVIPALPPGWRAVMTRPGATPLDSLAARLMREGLCEHDRAADPDALVAAIKRAAGVDRIVLIIDQFEELFTLCEHEAARTRYAEMLARLARSTDEPLRVVIAVRDDFLVRVEQLPALSGLLAQGFHLLSIPSVVDLERILVEPGRRVGYEFDDPSLPAEMAASVANTPGALALLSFTAWQLWEQRDKYFRRLTRRAYEAMEGVGGALAQHAEATLALMVPEDRELVRLVFRRLVTSEGTRAVVERAEVLQSLVDARRGAAVLDVLITRRLLVVSSADFGGDKLEVIHEALLEAWPRLVTWRREDTEGSRLREQLRVAAEQWHKRGRPRGLLWRDEALTEYRAWRRRFTMTLTELEAAFADTSLALERSTRRSRQTIVAAAVAVVVAGVVVLAFSERRATQNADRAQLQVALLHEQKGREALFSGDPMRAIVHLAEAMRGRDGEGVRHLVAAAARKLSSEELALDHGTRPWDARFSPDDELIATAGDGGTIRLWDARTGALLHSLPGPDVSWRHIAFNSDGTSLVAGGAHGVVALYDVRSASLVRQLAGHEDDLRDVLFMAGGSRIVTASHEGRIGIWSKDSAIPLHLLKLDHKLWRVRASPDDRRFVTADSDGSARVWSVETGMLELTLAGHTGTVHEATFSSDGRVIGTVGQDGIVVFWNAATGARLSSAPRVPYGLYLVRFFPDGKRAVVGGEGNVAQVVRVADGQVEATLIGHTSYLNDVAVAPDGGLIVTAGTDGTTRLWDGASGQPSAILASHSDAAWQVGFDRTGERFFAIGHDGITKVWHVNRVDGLALRGHDGAVVWAEFSKDGTRVFTIGKRRIATFDVATGALLESRDFDEPILCGLWPGRGDPSGARLLTCSGTQARVLDLASNRERTLQHGADIKVGNFSADGTRVLTAGLDGARLWDAATGAEIGRYPWQVNWVGAVALSRDGSKFATIVNDRNILVIDVATGATIATLRGGTLGYDWLEFSPDGSILATGGQDKTATLWRIANEQLIMTLEGHTADVVSVRFSPDGGRIVTAGADGTANLWDATSGELLLSFSAPPSVNWAAFHPDGQQIVVSGDDRAAHIWSVAMEARSPAEIDSFAHCHSPFRLDGARVVRRNRDPSACPGAIRPSSE